MKKMPKTFTMQQMITMFECGVERREEQASNYDRGVPTTTPYMYALECGFYDAINGDKPWEDRITHDVIREELKKIKGA